MKINPKIKDYLVGCNAPMSDMLAYCLAIYHEIKAPSLYTAGEVVQATGLVYMDGNGTVQWKIPLFEGQETHFDWVATEYEPLFAARDNGGKVREATARMKKLFSEHPHIRKEDVLEATKMYLKNTSMIRQPHYFIDKGRGADRVQDILDWIDKANLAKTMAAGRTGASNTMQ